MKKFFRQIISIEFLKILTGSTLLLWGIVGYILQRISVQKITTAKGGGIHMELFNITGLFPKDGDGNPLLLFHGILILSASVIFASLKRN